jgi:Mg2+-importing ATPase
VAQTWNGVSSHNERAVELELPKLTSGRWVSWLVGVAVLASVVALVFGFSEARQFLDLLQRARPAWLLVALALQSGTYLAQSWIWRTVAHAGHTPVPAATAYKLSLAKLFMDQALPSAGISGTIVVARALAARGVPAGTVAAGVIVNMVTYHGSYLLCLAAALAVAAAAGHARGWIVGAWALFALLGIALATAALTLSGRRTGALPSWIARLRPLRPALAILNAADLRILRSARVIASAAFCQFAIVLLDAFTLWAVIRATGASAPFERVFASFMISVFLRSISFVPSGLGTFEAASVLTLHLLGLPLPVALSSTLLFRLLSFWLPMLPGLVFSRAAARATPPPAETEAR